MFCKYEYCYLPHITRGYCDSHYRQYLENDKDSSKLKPLRYRSYHYNKCTTIGCYEIRHSNGLCTTHYNLFRADSSIKFPIKTEDECRDKCYVNWCDNHIHNLNLCETHYKQLKECKGEEVVDFLLDKYVRTDECKVPYCAKPQTISGYCSHHHYRSKRGEVLIDEHPTVPEQELANFKFNECEYLNCGRQSFEGGLCSAHKVQLDKNEGDYSKLTKIKNKCSDLTCDIADCTNVVYRNSKCEKHYRFERFELNLKNRHNNRISLTEKERDIET